MIVFSLVIQDTVPVSQWDHRYDYVYDVFKVSVRKETIVLMYRISKLASRSNWHLDQTIADHDDHLLT